MADKKPLVISNGSLNEMGSSDTIPLGNLGSGVASSTTYLRGDGAWVTPVVTSFAFTSDGTISEQPLDTFLYTMYGSAKYIIYVNIGTVRQVCELLILHDDTTPSMVEYANMVTSIPLAMFASDISGGFVRLLVTPTIPNINFKITRTLITI